MRAAIIIAAALALAACGQEEYQDLREELKNITKDLRGKVDPLPVVKPYEPVPYTAGDLPDPFGPAKIELVTKAAGLGSGPKPDLNRPKEPLESFPLESLRMVGVLQQNKEFYALVKADASLYRVKAGNHLGQNFGVITEISDNQIQLRELIQDAAGDWSERVSTLQLQESEAKK